MNITLVTLFPDMFDALNYGVVGRAIQQQRLKLECFNPRDFTEDKHRTVDDRPYGGGPGMLMKVAPLMGAIKAARKQLGGNAKTIYLSPQGRPVDQALLTQAAAGPDLILVSGRYEGIDQRIIDGDIDAQWSIGDYVLSGGELPAMVVIDGITRLLPGVLGHEDSAREDSFMQGLLDHPQYTRPEVIADKAVPQVLLNGDHAAIAQWRLKQALGQTWLKRPDLLVAKSLSDKERDLLEAFKREYEN